MVFFYRSIAVQTLIHAFILYRIYKHGDIHPTIKYLLYIVYGIETTIYFTGLFFHHRLPIDTVGWIQIINGIWVVAQGYLLGLIIIFDFVVYLIRRRIHSLFFTFSKKHQLRYLKIVCFVVFLLLITCRLFVGYENFLHPKIETIQFAFFKSDAPDRLPLKKYKILVASDIHLGYIINKQTLDKYIDIINAQQADMVVIAGDLIDYDMRPLIESQMDQELKKITSPLGVFVIPGNHEYKIDFQKCYEWMIDAGMTVLKDSVVEIDQMLQLIGRDDRKREKERKSIEELMATVDINQPTIFFTHQPGDINDACNHHLPLIICGHSHNGQAWPGNMISKLIYPNGYGMKKIKGSTTYTTSGLGLSGFPLRIASQSEILIVDIEIF